MSRVRDLASIMSAASVMATDLELSNESQDLKVLQIMGVN